MDDDGLVNAACMEIVECTQDRHSVLIFAAGVDHARHIQSVLESYRQECGLVCGDTLPFERAETLKRFKEGKLKFLVNVNVLTTGFDAPNIDCVVLLRPTNSPGLYYQMVGRGFRIDPSKNDCLVLDFGSNILRHGPVDALMIKDKSASDESTEPPAKECPDCRAVIHAGYGICPQCGFEFPPPQKQQHEETATTAGVLSGQVTDTDCPVSSVAYGVHRKRNAPGDHPPTMRVTYNLGYLNETFCEWVCIEHTGYARNKAETWWRRRSNEPVPATVDQAVAIARAGGLAEPTEITIRSIAGQRFDRLVACKLPEKPPRLDGSDERDDGNLPAYASPIDDEVPF